MLMAIMLDHDRICAQEVAQMYDLGCFAEQFVTYATCCLLGNEHHYFVTDKAENAYQFCWEKLQEDVYCLPVSQQTQSSLAPSGHRESLQQQCKLAAANQLRDDGAGEAVDQLMLLAGAANNGAEKLLNRIKNALSGCFAEEILQLFAGFADFAFAARKISAFQYGQYQQWLAEVRKDATDEAIRHDVHERVYAGFAYVKADGALGYYHNAVEAMTLQRRSALQERRIMVTPVFRKRYCFGDISCIGEIAADFRLTLRRRLDKGYMAILRAIYQLPSAVDKTKFMTALAGANSEPLMVQTLYYYGTLWNVW